MFVLQFQLVRVLAGLALAFSVSQPALAQRIGGHRGEPHGGGRHRAEPPTAPGKPVARAEAETNQAREDREARRLHGVPPRWMERLQDMSPAQQDRFLNNNERFQNLPPERQALIRRRLQWWNGLTPEQRLAIRERQRIWEQMAPEKQRHVRDELLPKWRQLPPDRRQAIVERLHLLHRLSEAERTAKLNDLSFLAGLSPEDREMLRELSHLRVGNAPEPPQENP